MSARFNPGDRVVGLSGYAGTVIIDQGELVNVALDNGGGTGLVERCYLSPMKPGVVPHKQDSSAYFH